MPVVTIIMAAYNSEEYIAKSIESIKSQTLKEWELIICDDNSTDNTFEIASRFAKENDKIKVIKNQTNKKAAYSRNECIRIAKGKFIAIQDADDLSKSVRLEQQIEFLNLNKEYDFVGSKSSSFDENGIWKTTNPIKYPVKKDFLKGLPFTHASIMFRKSALEKVKGYRVSRETVRGEDTDMIMRMYSIGLKGASIQEVLYLYREDLNAVKRRSFKSRLYATTRNFKRFKDLGLLSPQGCIYAFKPIIGGLIPKSLYLSIQKRKR